jgi:hypothetical protein
MKKISEKLRESTKIQMELPQEVASLSGLTQAEIDAMKAEAEAAHLASGQTLAWVCSLTPAPGE